MVNSYKVRPRLLTAIMLFATYLLWMVPAAFSKAPLVGKWQVTITMPTSPGSSQKNTFTVTLDVSPMDTGSLNGRLTVTDQQNRTISGVWREVGKMISITYEPVCDQSQPGPCATLVLLGKVKGGGTIVKGQLVVEWDTPDTRNPALYDTDNGKFSGQLLDPQP
jgi:hypothetical protein